MAVSTALVSTYTPYVIGATPIAPFTYTSTQYTTFLAAATEKFARDDPGFTGIGKPDLADEAVCYLIADKIWWFFNGYNENTSEKLGGMARTRHQDKATGDLASPWMGKYLVLISRELVAPTSGMIRNDVVFNAGMKLSDQPIPEPINGDEAATPPTPWSGPGEI